MGMKVAICWTIMAFYIRNILHFWGILPAKAVVLPSVLEEPM
jgi:hypothetical protein